MREVLAIADDLSGAAEVAQHLGGPVHLAATPYAGGVAVIDLDTRHLPPDEAAQRVCDALSRVTPPVVFHKVDSLLRGNLAAGVAAVRAAGRAVVVAPALPGGGRVVLDGVPHVDGVPLAGTAAWHLESRPPPATVAEVLRPLATRPVGLAEVRSGRLSFARAIHAGEVPVCDAVTDHDLDRIVDAALELPAPALVGSGGLAAALGRRLGPPPLLVVVGTAAPSAREQVDRLVAGGAKQIEVGVDSTDPEEIERALASGPVVLSLEPGVLPGRARELAGALGRLVAAVPSIASCDLVLTGGETARRVLEALRVTALRPIREIHPGAVHSLTAGGRSVVTRPGSFGGPDSLVHIVRTLGGLD